ncbi:MAG: ABC transporter permease [Spirochaetales bacterium]|nr:ABC transporter permease [Spirochaetales bacterium]
MGLFERYWSFKLLAKSRRTIGNVVLIMLVMIPLVISLVFVDSMIDGITTKYIRLAGGHIQFKADSDAVVDNPALSRTVSGFAELYTQKSNASALIKGVDASYFNDERLSQIQLTSSDWKLDGNFVIISENLRRKMNLEIGDKFALLMLSNPEQSQSASFSPVFRPLLVKLGGVYSSGYSQLDDTLVFASFDFLSEILKEEYITLEMLTDSNLPEENLKTATKVMSENEDLLSFKLWNEMNTQIYMNFVSSRQMIMIIIIVIAFIACFYAGTVVHEIVQDNFSEICTMRLLGARDIQIKRTVFLAVLAIIILGVVLGIGIGLLVSFNLSPLLKLLASSGFSGFSMYLLDFNMEIDVPVLLSMGLLVIVVSSISVLISLRNERKISPLLLLRN